MHLLSSAHTVLDFLFRRSRAEREMEEEFRSHLRSRADELERQGLSRAEAERQARIEFGGYQRYKEECREALGTRLLGELLADLRYGLRQLRGNPGFTAVAVITLAVGIGANTAIFSVVSEILIRKPRVRDPDRLVTLSSRNIVRGFTHQLVSALDFESWQRQSHVFEGMAAANIDRPFTLTGAGEPQPLLGDSVTANYFDVMGVYPVLGRAFLQTEALKGHDHEVILSDSLWRARFGASPEVLGKVIYLDDEPYTVIGVMPPGTDIFTFAPRLWTPLVFSPHDVAEAARADRHLNVFARLRPGVTVRQAQAEMDTIADRLARAHPRTDKDWRVTVLTLQKFMIEVANVRRALTILMLTVGCVLLIACANIAGLLLARGAARGHEMAIRSAVGASHLRLIRQMLAESLLVGAVGGATGLVMSVWGIRMLRFGFDFNFYGRQLAAGLHLDEPTVLFTVAISICTSIVFGLVPAIRASRISLTGVLSEGARTGPTSLGRSNLRSVLVVAEIALALILLTGSGVMMKELIREITQPPGFNPEHVLTAGIGLPTQRYPNPADQARFFRRVTKNLRSLPGITSASAASALPLTGAVDPVSFNIAGRAPTPESKHPLARRYVVGVNYFATMEIPVIRGRAFLRSDRADSPAVVIVNERFARTFFSKGDAIGQRIQLDLSHPISANIVGIVGNVSDYTGELIRRPQIYQSYSQAPDGHMDLVVRSSLDPSLVAPMLRRAVWSVDKDQPVGDITGGVLTMKQVSRQGLGGDNLMAALLAIFAALALILAAVGIYGVVAYSVNQRTREIGIRMALGAQKVDVLALVLRQGSLLTFIGCAIGLAMSLPLPKVFAGIFGGFAGQGVMVPIAVGGLVAAVSLLACYIPARRAARVDPMVALRYE